MINYNVLNYPQKIIDRFWSKVKVIYNPDGTPDFDSCMLWTAGCFSDWYGCFSLYQHSVRSHRFIYECFYGNIPQDLLVCHTCDTPLCVNPYHLWAGTNIENLKDMVNKGRSLIGENSKNSKLNSLIIEQLIIDIYNSKYSSIPKLAKAYNICSINIHAILKGEIWNHITHNICYKLGTTLNIIYNLIKYGVYGSENVNGKLNNSDVIKIKKLILKKIPNTDIAKYFNVTQECISAIKNNKTWTYIL